MGGGVNPQREPADHDHARGSQPPPQRIGHLQPIGRRPARAHNRDCGVMRQASKQPAVADREQHHRRIGELAQRVRIGPGMPANGPHSACIETGAGGGSVEVLEGPQHLVAGVAGHCRDQGLVGKGQQSGNEAARVVEQPADPRRQPAHEVSTAQAWIARGDARGRFDRSAHAAAAIGAASRYASASSTW